MLAYPNVLSVPISRKIFNSAILMNSDLEFKDAIFLFHDIFSTLNSSRKSFSRKIISAKSFESSFDPKPNGSTLKIRNTCYGNNSI